MKTKICFPLTPTVIAAALLASLAGCAQYGGRSGAAVLEVTQGVVIQNVTVVNTRDGSLAPGMSLVIDGGKIAQVVPAPSIRVGGAAQAIDATGKFVVPGFLDMHTHAMTAAGKQPTHWPLLLANGITGIREMAGSAELIQQARRLNADIAAGRIDAPEVLQLPGPLLLGVATPAQAVSQVQQQKALGADFIKFIAGSRDATLATLAEAKKQGLGVSGHLVPSVSATEASQAGWRSIEHLGAGLGLPLDCATDGESVRRALLNGEGVKVPFTPLFILNPIIFIAKDAPFYQRVVDSYSADKCLALAQVFAQNQTWQVPTLIRIRTMQISNDPAYRSDPNLIYVDKTTQALWQKLGRQFASDVPPAAAATFSQYYGLQAKLTLLFKRNGVKMMAGSDLGGGWVIPGFSLHQEFRLLAEAGLSPLEVLQMTTLNGAEFLQRQATMGTVEAGKNADLVLLEANPIDSVANLGKISAVVLKGRYLPKAALEKMKNEVAESYKNQPLKDLSAVLDPNHRH